MRTTVKSGSPITSSRLYNRQRDRKYDIALPITARELLTLQICDLMEHQRSLRLHVSVVASSTFRFTDGEGDYKTLCLSRVQEVSNNTTLLIHQKDASTRLICRFICLLAFTVADSKCALYKSTLQ